MNKLAGLTPGFLGAAELVVGAAVVLLFIFACFYAARSLFWRGIKVPGGRGRQQRLGAVDVFNLDQSRQLVLVRRDNVEHLVLIGGPNDVLIESQIVRVEPRNLRERELSEVAPPISTGAPRAAMPNTQLQVPPLAPVAPPPGVVSAPAATIPAPQAAPVQRNTAFNPPPRHDPPVNPPVMAPPAPEVAVPTVAPVDPALALMAALGSALDLKEDTAAQKAAPSLAPARISPPGPAVAAPPSLRAPLQRPVFERAASSSTRPPAPRPERTVPSLASMSARQLPQPTPKAEPTPPAQNDETKQAVTATPARATQLNELLSGLSKTEAAPKIEVMPPAPVAEAQTTPPATLAESAAQDSLETEMARLLGRPLNGG